MRTCLSLHGILGLVLGVGLIAGCGKSPGVDSNAFDSAAPEIKAVWQKAKTAAQSRDYFTALTTYQQLLRNKAGLTAEQIKAAETAATGISDQMYEAANNGDAAAQKAVEELRKVYRR